MNDKKFLCDFCHKYGYSTDAEAALLSCAEAIEVHRAAKEKMEHFIEIYEQDCLPEGNEFLSELDKISEYAQTQKYTVHLLYLIYLTPHLHDIYQEKGYSDRVFDQTVDDLRNKMRECYQVYGVYGVFVSWWLIDFFRATRFALGRLQFELIPCPVAYSRAGIFTEVGQTVINVHIPSSGKLHHEDCMKAYAMAETFFADEFKQSDAIPFFCHSWMLFPKNNDILSENSNIRRFAEDYNVLAWEEDPTYDDMWRIFSCSHYDGKPENLPTNTGLKTMLL